jgi:L-2-hydroxyglutarate oxidase LhgO
MFTVTMKVPANTTSVSWRGQLLQIVDGYVAVAAHMVEELKAHGLQVVENVKLEIKKVEEDVVGAVTGAKNAATADVKAVSAKAGKAAKDLVG